MIEVKKQKNNAKEQKNSSSAYLNSCRAREIMYYKIGSLPLSVNVNKKRRRKTKEDTKRKSNTQVPREKQG